jgi:hypothetical protein
MAMGDCNSNGNGNGNGDGSGDGVDNGDRDGDGDGNGDGHSKGSYYKGKVASSCGGNVQCFLRGNTLPLPSWTQRKVHSPVLRHEGDTAKSVCSLSRGRVPDRSPWIVFCSFFTTTVQFTEQPTVHPPHYSGAQELCQPIDALPPSLLQEPRQPIDNLPRLLLHFLPR